MALYEFTCVNDHCHVKDFSIAQPMAAVHEAVCPECGTPAKRKLRPTPIIFKGRGFYKTDNPTMNNKEKTRKDIQAVDKDSSLESKE